MRDLVLFRTPPWVGANEVRLRPDGQATLLLRPDDESRPVFRYSAALNSLTFATAAEWAASAGTVRSSAEQLPALHLRTDPEHVVGTFASPGGTFASVVTGRGRAVSFMPFLGQGVKGPFFHQLVTLPTGAAVESAVRLPFKSSTSWVRACWSADEHWLVFADVVFSSLVVLPLAGRS